MDKGFVPMSKEGAPYCSATCLFLRCALEVRKSKRYSRLAEVTE